MKIERLLSIVIHLMSRDLVSATALAERFGVTVRTIQRDMETIDAAGIPVTALHGPNGGYKIMDTFRLDRQFFTFDDLFFITTALQGVADSLESPTIEKTADKIRSLTRQGAAQEIAQRAQRLCIDFSALGFSSRRKEHFAVVQDAVARNRCISFTYTSSRLETSTRVVEPYAIVFKWFSWYLFAWCRSRKAFRLFRLSRLRDTVLKPEVFKRREVDVQRYLDSMSTGGPAPVSALLRFRPELRVLVEDFFSYADIRDDESGFLLVKLELPEDNWLYGMILSYGDGVEVISPAPLREKIAEISRKTLQLYQ
jgi:predicted DNA-binding transcriptional regulator YafY